MRAVMEVIKVKVIKAILLTFLCTVQASGMTTSKMTISRMMTTHLGFGPDCPDSAADNMMLICRNLPKMDDTKCQKIRNKCCLFGGDGCLSPGQIEQRVAGMNKKRKKRDIDLTVFENTDNQWPKGVDIPYTFDPRFLDDDKAVVRAAFEEIGNKTCTSFAEEAFTPSFEGLVIRSNDTGCWSFVGKTEYTQQTINLQSPGCIDVGIALHEIGHALGLIHEHQRPDRDDFVMINFDNLNEDSESQFIKDENAYIVNNYDYNSIMHYEPTAFSNNGQLTIEALDPQFLSNLGQLGRLSLNDIGAINSLYCDPGQCTNGPACQNFGMPDPTDCTRCICRPKFTGELCENLAMDTTGNCQAEGARTMTPGTTEMFTLNNHVSNVSVTCVWNLTLTDPNHSFIVSSSLTGPDFDIFCPQQWIEIRTDEDENFVTRHCKNVNEPQNVVYDSAFLLISSEYFPVGLEMSGFTLTVTTDINECNSGAADCSENADCTNTVGSFTCTCKEGFSGDGVNCREITTTTTTMQEPSMVPPIDEGSQTRLAIIFGSLGGGLLVLLIVTFTCVLIMRQRSIQRTAPLPVYDPYLYGMPGPYMTRPAPRMYFRQNFTGPIPAVPLRMPPVRITPPVFMNYA